MLRLEAVIVADALREGEHLRLLDWIEAHPSLEGLVAQAVRVAEEWRAA